MENNTYKWKIENELTLEEKRVYSLKRNIVNTTNYLLLDTDKVMYLWKEYDLIELSKESVLSVTWSNEENMSKWALAINWNKIYHYWIRRDFLQYAVIQEILCPDMVNNFNINSIEEEMKIIPEKIFDDYLKWRISFFENMVKYWEWLSEKDLEKIDSTENKQVIYIKNLKLILDYLNSIKNLDKN